MSQNITTFFQKTNYVKYKNSIEYLHRVYSVLLLNRKIPLLLPEWALFRMKFTSVKYTFELKIKNLLKVKNPLKK